MAVGSSKKKKPKHPSSHFSTPMASSSFARPKSSSKFRLSFRSRAVPPLIIFSLCMLTLFFVTQNNKISSLESGPDFYYSFDVVNEFPHDPHAFTQGLLYGGNDTLFESTGLYGRSSVRQVNLQTGKVEVYHQMDGFLFGEGLTLLGERLLQVTWLKKTGFIYDRYNFNKRRKFTHQMQDGWGLATDGKVIFGSDGSSTLYQLDPVTWKAIDQVTVKYNTREVPYLNELEYIGGEVWANVWQSDCIARISHNDGVVQGWILLHELRQSLLKSGHKGIDVLNGIAWDEENSRLFVTGKLWPKLYEIKLRQVTLPPNSKIEDLCLNLN
ncbi:glutaminyl-peptide cyclotransferase [Iris pallida]|uniref:Glutaminyl-peptide cyclotransferase n=1 Tax=Iris pallida TaxID=29817 RepID=A0AAX6ETG4_IRIPA|nr:glutaminyl-peptide cyclotransferase [Iris pallida]